MDKAILPEADGYQVAVEATLDERRDAIRQRTTRGMMLYNSGGVVHLEADLWAVRAQELGGFYRADLRHETCTCPDYEHRARALGITCKHVYAAAIASARAEQDLLDELERLEERYRHELMDDEERQELRDRIMRIKRGGG